MTTAPWYRCRGPTAPVMGPHRSPTKSVATMWLVRDRLSASNRLYAHTLPITSAVATTWLVCDRLNASNRLCPHALPIVSLSPSSWTAAARYLARPYFPMAARISSATCMSCLKTVSSSPTRMSPIRSSAGALILGYCSSSSVGTSACHGSGSMYGSGALRAC